MCGITPSKPVRIGNGPAINLSLVNVEPIAQMQIVPQRLLPPLVGKHKCERERDIVERKS